MDNFVNSDSFTDAAANNLTGYGLLGAIVAGIIQVLPLILVPLLLKGILDSVPVLGKAAQNLMNKSTKAARDYGNKDAGFFGRRRAEYMNNQRSLTGRKLTDAERRDPNRRTLGNRYQSYSHAREEQLKAIKGQGGEEMRARVHDDSDPTYSTRIAQAAHHQDQRTTTLKALNEQKDKESYGTRLVTDQSLIDMDQETVARAYSQRDAGVERQNMFAERLKREKAEGIDDGLLKVAAGDINPSRGRNRALGAAYSATYKDFDETVQNEENRITEETSNLAKGGPVQDYDVNSGALKWQTDADGNEIHDATGNRVPVMMSGSEASTRYLSRQLRSSDTHVVAAARNKMFAQGASGVTRFINEWSEMQSNGHFETKTYDADGKLVSSAARMVNVDGQQVSMADVKIDLQRNLANNSGLASQLKGKNKLAMNAISRGVDIPDFLASDDATAVAVGMTDKEIGESTTQTLLQMIANGSFGARRAAAVLTDDMARNNYNQEQLQILQVLKDGGSDIENDPVQIPIRDMDGKKLKDAAGNFRTETGTRGQAAVQAIWNTSNGRLRKKPVLSNPDVETNDTIDLSLVVAPGKAVPGPGSPAKVIADYIDKSGAIDRISRDDFLRLQTAVSTSATPDDDDDYKAVKAQVEGELRRRNASVSEVNQAAGSDVYVNISGVSRNPMGGAQQPKPDPNIKYAQNVSRQQVKFRAVNVTHDLGIDVSGLSGLRLGDSDLQSFDQKTVDRINEVIRVYDETIKSANGTPQQGQINDLLKGSLQQDIERAINNRS